MKRAIRYQNSQFLQNLKYTFLLAASLMIKASYSQEANPNPLAGRSVIKLSDDGKSFIKTGFATQMWIRAIQYNPDTYDPSGNELKYDMDFVLRRTTMSTLIKADRFVAFANLGTGTQTISTSISPFTSTKPTIYFYDLFASYELVKEKLRLGYGLSLYRGISRASSSTALSTIGVDVPLLAAPDVITTEQTARHLGLFAVGNISIVNYRLILGKPFLVNSAGRPPFGVDRAADIPTTNLSIEGYFSFQFLDKEKSFMPFFTGTYLGKKKLFNIGAGFYSHPESTQSINSNSDTVTHNKFHYAVDLFIEYPVLSGGAANFYACYYSYNYGPNYYLSGAIANDMKAYGSSNSGITEPGFGTGSAVAVQAAFLLPKTFGEAGRVQFYYEGNYMFLDALNDPAPHHNIGGTYFVHDHNLKFSLEYQLRPYMSSGDFDSYKSLAIFKTQVFF